MQTPYIILSEKEVHRLLACRGATEYRLYLILVMRRNRKTKRCDPSIRRIADALSITKRGAQLSLNILVSQGLVKKCERLGNTTQYTFPLRESWEKEMEEPVENMEEPMREYLSEKDEAKNDSMGGVVHISPGGVNEASPKPEEERNNQKKNIEYTNVYSSGERKKPTLHELIDGYFEIRGYSKASKENLTLFYKRNARPAKEILTLSKDNVDISLKAIRIVKNWAESRGLDWTLETVVKRWRDIPRLSQRNHDTRNNE